MKDSPTVHWYTSQDLNTYWPDFHSALSPHPTMSSSSYTFAVPNTLSREDSIITRDGSEAPVTFLIYGKTGWIGGMLGRLLRENKEVYFYGSARLHDRSVIKDDIARCRPTHILNAAGITGRPNVDWCETHKREVVKTNVLGTINLIDIAHTHGIHVTNFATGCIYTYNKDHLLGSGHGFTEDDAPNFRGSYYSNTKAMVEELIKEYDNVLQLVFACPSTTTYRTHAILSTKLRTTRRW